MRALLPVVLSLCIGGSAAAQSLTPDPVRAALAKELAELLLPPSQDTKAAAMQAKLWESLAMMTMAFSGADFGMDEKVLKASLMAAADASTRQRRAQASTAFSTLPEADLHAALAFYRGSDGRAAIRAREAYSAKLDAWLKKTADREAKGTADPPAYKPSAAEAAFLSSPAAQAIDSAVDNDGDHGADAMDKDIVSLETIYCARAACGEEQREFFKRVGATASPNRAKGEHAMWGDTAGDLFPDRASADLARAACKGDGAAVAAAAKAGADPNASGKDGMWTSGGKVEVTPLVWALDCRSLPGVEALVAAGADPNRKGRWNDTAVTLAASIADHRFLSFLLAHRGDPNAATDRESALMVALQTGISGEVDKLPKPQAWANWEQLLAAGASVNVGNEPTSQVLDKAVMMNQFDRGLELIMRGARYDPVDVGRWVTMSEEQNHAGPEQEPHRAALKARLQQEGVKFPVGATMGMKRGANGRLIQP